MDVGLQIPSFHWPGGPDEMRSRLAEICRAADVPATTANAALPCVSYWQWVRIA